MAYEAPATRLAVIAGCEPELDRAPVLIGDERR
jgi:hypothetical protein